MCKNIILLYVFFVCKLFLNYRCFKCERSVSQKKMNTSFDSTLEINTITLSNSSSGQPPDNNTLTQTLTEEEYLNNSNNSTTNSSVDYKFVVGNDIGSGINRLVVRMLHVDLRCNKLKASPFIP